VEGIGEDPAVAVSRCVGAPQHHLGSFEQRAEGVPCLTAAGRGLGVRPGERRDFNGGKPDLAAVLERESSAIDNARRSTARDSFAATRERTYGLLLRRSAGTSEHDCQIGRNGRGQAPVPPADHRRQGKGGNAAALRQ